MRKVLTLCLIQKEDKVLLGMKKRGFGKDRWNGFGGHVEEGEQTEEAALREVQEEAGIVLHSLEKRGVLEFEFLGNQEVLEVHVFHAASFEGEPVETEEMKPQWFSLHEIPFHEMWPDDRFWLPLFLEGKNFRGRFLFHDENTIADYVLTEAAEG